MSVDLTDITMEFPGVRALDRVSVTFGFDEVHGLIGENGAGKSTLMSVLAGTRPPTSGRIAVDGRPAAFHSTRDAMHRGIALVSQEGSLVPALTAAENILLGDEPTRAGLVRRSELNRRARRLLDAWFPGVGIDLAQPVDRLDMAERKVVEIVRALRGDIRLLILDEPTATLQAREKGLLWDIIRNLPGKGVGVVLVSHFLTEVKALSDRITVLRDGRQVGTHPAAALSDSDMVQLMLRRGLHARGGGGDGEDRPLGGPGPVGQRLAGRTVSVPRFELPCREIVGLIGLHPGGPPRTFRGLLPARSIPGSAWGSGTMVLDGKPVPRPAPASCSASASDFFVPDQRNGERADARRHDLREPCRWFIPRRVGGEGLLSRRRERRESRRVMDTLNVRATAPPTRPSKTLSGRQTSRRSSLGKWL